MGRQSQSVARALVIILSKPIASISEHKEAVYISNAKLISLGDTLHSLGLPFQIMSVNHTKLINCSHINNTEYINVCLSTG